MSASTSRTPKKSPPLHPKGRAFSQFGLAKRFVDQYGDRVRYVEAWNKWLIWNGQRWQMDTTGQVRDFGASTIESLLIEAEHLEDKPKRSALLEFGHESQRRLVVKDLLELAQVDRAIAVQHDQLDRAKLSLTVKNGQLNLKTGRLNSHSVKNLNTRSTDIEWDAEAECPRWLEFLNEVMDGNQELIAFLKRAFGYSLTGEVSEQVLLFLHGDGSNGKSVLCAVLLELLGDFAHHAPPSLLVASKKADHPTAQAGLFGKRAVICQEVGQDQRFDEVTLKLLTGGDPITTRRMREDWWTYQPTHTLWLAANHQPDIRGRDHAIWRRILLIPFNVTFGKKGSPKKDRKLLAKLLAELPGILRWSVEGAKEWQKNGLKPPDEVFKAVNAYRERNDVISSFVDQCVVLDKHCIDGVSARDMYVAFSLWCRETGETAFKQRAFGPAMVDKGLSSQRRGGSRWYVGLKLTDSARALVIRADAAAEGEPKAP